MDINEKILRDIEPYLYSYDCEKNEVIDFLEHSNSFDKRQEKATRIIEGIITRHGKSNLLESVARLAKFELDIRELEPHLRDHVVHALLSFILGIYINEKFFQQIFRIHVNPFQWELAGLFHDIGHPVEVAKGIMESYADNINEIQHELGVDVADVTIEIFPKNLELLTNKLSSFDLIQAQLKEWSLNINARKKYREMIKSGDICHGMISGLSVLKIIDLLYQRYNPKREYKQIFSNDSVDWNQQFFDGDIIPACSAIFIHNFSGVHFARRKIKLDRAPLAFLLKLSDSLQDWERPSKDDPVGISSSKYDITVCGDQLIFKADDPDTRSKIYTEISSCLEAANMQICSL